jgi:hypothetical protein
MRQSAKKLQVRKANVGKRNTPKGRLTATGLSNEIQVHQVLVSGHGRRVERITKHSCKEEVAILHQGGNTPINTVLLVRVGRSR